MNIHTINPLTFPDYDKMVLAAGGSIFHTSYWARVLQESYFYRPSYLVNIHHGIIDFLIPLMEVNSWLTGRRGVSLPFTDYCEPIINDVNNGRDVMNHLIEYGSSAQWKYLELRGGEQIFGQVPSSSSYYRHVLKLSKNVDAVYARLKGRMRTSVKKAVREGVTINRSNTLDAVKMYYNLHCITRKKHGVPPQPFHFFRRIYDHIINQGHGQVVLATFQGNTIAGAIFFQYGHEAIHKFGASDSRYLHLRPNDLIMWDTIQWYCCNGFTQLCLGRTELENEGLRHFKNGWGTEELLIRYFKYNLKRKEFEVNGKSYAGIAKLAFQQMPISLLKGVGKVLYKHVG